MNQDTYTVYTYGFLLKDIEEIAKILETVLNLTWQGRESATDGDYYLYPPFKANYRGESLKLCTNYVIGEWRWNSWKYRKYRILLYVWRSDRISEIETRMKSTFGDKVALIGHQP